MPTKRKDERDSAEAWQAGTCDACSTITAKKEKLPREPGAHAEDDVRWCSTITAKKEKWSRKQGVLQACRG